MGTFRHGCYQVCYQDISGGGTFGVVLKTAFAPLRVSASVADRNSNHHRDLALGNQGVQSRKELPVRPVRPDHERRDATGHVLLGDIDRDFPFRQQSRPEHGVDTPVFDNERALFFTLPSAISSDPRSAPAALESK